MQNVHSFDYNYNIRSITSYETLCHSIIFWLIHIQNFALHFIYRGDWEWLAQNEEK